jgi:carboxymethylenebutenolidase
MTTSSTITLTTDDGAMPTYQAAPEGPAKGGVVVVQEAFGVTTHIEEVARRFADAGWHAVAPSFFHRQGSPVLAYDDFSKVMPVMSTLEGQGLAVDLQAAIDQLGSAGHVPGRVAVVGFCMGGSVALYAGTLWPLGAAVTFYGGGVTEARFEGLASLESLAPTLQTPWLGLYGDQDTSISVEQIERLRSAAASAPVATEVVRYADGQHGFHCNDRPAVFNAPAAADAWQRTLAWLDAQIGS